MSAVGAAHKSNDPTVMTHGNLMLADKAESPLFFGLNRKAYLAYVSFCPVAHSMDIWVRCISMMIVVEIAQLDLCDRAHLQD